MKRWFALFAVSALLVTPTASAVTDTSKLRKHVRVEAIVKYMGALERIADANEGTRASGTPGYTASVDYIVPWLQDKGYQVTVQTFPFAYFQEVAEPQLSRVAPSPQDYVGGTDFDTMTYSGSGDVTANVQAVDTTATPSATSTSGCETSDFLGFVPGRIALVQRGTCTFGQKAQNAQAAGASAVVIFNRGTTGFGGLLVGTLGSPGFTIPVLGLPSRSGKLCTAPTALCGPTSSPPRSRKPG